ncbi:uncharacterized protein [Medicago truncatula]|uniref:uncharacterized protein n=1 Tax=Medicago truncatula TaxID=3880 RepID=UPI000D2F2FF6|nr:uncharacterized protein LOC112420216 [Medicago truncatula]
MNLHDKSWNEQVVRQVFSVDIADKILHTPLISQVEADIVIWKAERHGRYSVRSAYRLCATELIDSSYLWRLGYWSGIWNLKVPPKVWNRTGLWSSVQHALSHTTSVSPTSAELAQRLSTVMWSLWKHRNLRVWDDATETSVVVVERAKNMVTDWQLANILAVLASTSPPQQVLATNMGASSSHQHNKVLWQPPTSGRYKCNIDAALSSHHNRTGIGICVRDSEGSFVLAKSITYPCIVSVDVGEALGLHSALQWMSDMQFDNVDFETDSKLTVDAFLATRNDLSEFGSIMTSCRSLFRNLFSNSRVEFVRRQANAVAHALAREATSLASPAVYYDIPNCIESLMINEML